MSQIVREHLQVFMDLIRFEEFFAGPAGRERNCVGIGSGNIVQQIHRLHGRSGERCVQRLRTQFRKFFPDRHAGQYHVLGQV
ncbi:hypothetical protein AAFN69_00870 [Streptomyces sp. CAU 1734]